ncbi:MAG: hypothetical protein AAF402_13515 [Pseudomonadota bacterium]
MNYALHKLSLTIVFALVASLTLYRLWLTADLSYLFPMLSPHDGTWFVTKAVSILEGNWFGEYDSVALIKGPVFPLFLAALSQLGISPRFGIDLLYCISCVIAYAAVVRISGRTWLSLIVLVLLLFNPITLSQFWVGSTRQQLYLPLCITYLSSLLVVSSVPNVNRSDSLGWSVLCGVSLALAWNTREESIWLLVPLAISIACFFAFHKHSAGNLTVRTLKSVLPVLLIPVLVWSAFALKNHEEYDFYGTVDFKSEQFSRAINAILSLSVKPHSYNHHLTLETKDKMLKISGSTRKLITPLLNSDLESYKHFGPSVPGAKAAWVIRDSVGLLGHYTTYPQSEAFYKQIADDIESYCSDHKHECNSPLIFNLKWSNKLNSKFIDSIPVSISRLVRFRFFDTEDNIEAFHGGDNLWRYYVSRYFHYNGYARIAHAERRLTGLNRIDQRRAEQRKRMYEFYRDHFYQILLVSLFLICFAMFRGPNKLLTLGSSSILATAIGSSLFIYLLVLVSVTNLPRIMISSSGPLIILAGLGFAIIGATTSPTSRRLFK